MPESLRVEPDAGARAAELCEDAATELDTLAAELDQEPLAQLLRWHTQVLGEFADRFRMADPAYGEAERGGADRYPT